MRKELIKLDAERLSTDVDHYIEVNQFQYELAELCLDGVAQYVDGVVGSRPYLQKWVKLSLSRYSLIEFIGFCKTLSRHLIHALDMSGGNTDALGEELLFIKEDRLRAVYDNFVTFGYTQYPRELLQFLRFLNRFSPISADKLQAESLKGLIAINSRNKGVRPSSWVLQEISYIITELFNVPKFRKEPQGKAYFTSGSTLDVGKNSSKKHDMLIDWFVPPTGGMVLGYHKTFDNIRSTDWFSRKCESCPYLASNCQSCPFGEEGWDYFMHTGENPPMVRVMSVPKKYDSARIVGEEQIRRSFFMTMVRDALLACRTRLGKKYLRLETQDRNRVVCYLSSLDGSYVTADLTSASDSIACHVGYACYDWLEDVLNTVRARWLVTVSEETADGTWWEYEVRRNYIFNTSGNVLTFPLMMGILAAAMLLAKTLMGSKRDGVVYGDDVIVPTEYYALFKELIENLGFIVNDDKTFISTGPCYRESCGIEVVNGLEVTTTFWPRKELTASAESLPLVIDLQHKLWEIGCETHLYESAVTRYIPEGRPLRHVSPFSTAVGWWGIVEDYVSYRGDVDHDKLLKFAGDVPNATVVEAEHYLAPKCAKLIPSTGDLQKAYFEYLKEGPYYADPLDELLGVSTSRVSNHTNEEVQIKLRLR